MASNRYTCPSEFTPTELSVVDAEDEALIDLHQKLGQSPDEAGCDLYLIKVPIGVDIASLNKKTVNLHGVSDLGKFDKDGVMSLECHTTHEPNEIDSLSILLPGESGLPGKKTVAKAKFKGQLNIIKSIHLPGSECTKSDDITKHTNIDTSESTNIDDKHHINNENTKSGDITDNNIEYTNNDDLNDMCSNNDDITEVISPRHKSTDYTAKVKHKKSKKKRHQDEQ